MCSRNEAYCHSILMPCVQDTPTHAVDRSHLFLVLYILMIVM